MILGTVHALAVGDFRQGLAAARLRQWASARQRMKAGHRPVMAGLRGRPSGGNRTALADAALVNCVDFERALAKLEKRLQTLLILRYRDGQTQALVAEGMGISVRAVHYLEPLALNKLADALDVEDFL